MRNTSDKRDTSGNYLRNKRYAARFFGVSLWTIDRWVAANRIPYVKLHGHLIRFRPEDLVAFIEASPHHGGQPSREVSA